MGKRIIVSALDFPGVQSVLWHGHWEKIWTRIDFQDLDTIEQDENTTIILGAFTPSYTQVIHKLKEKGFKVGIFWTSSLGQMEQVPEEIDLFNHASLFLQKGELDFALCGDWTLPLILERGLIYAPYPISFKLARPINIPKESKIGMFLPQHSRKNILNQVFSLPLLLSKMFPTVELHHNLMLPHPPIANIPYAFITDQPSFLKILGGLRVSLMVTHTESFGYSFVDAVLAGTIPILGPAMAEYFREDCFPDFAIPIVCPNPDSPREIALTIAPWLECSDSTYKEAITELRAGLKRLAKKNNAQLKKILGGSLWITSHYAKSGTTERIIFQEAE